MPPPQIGSKMYPIVTAKTADASAAQAAAYFKRELEVVDSIAESLATIAVKYCWHHKRPLTFGLQLVYSVVSHYRGDWEPEGKYGRANVEARQRANAERTTDGSDAMAVEEFSAYLFGSSAAKDSR